MEAFETVRTILAVRQYKPDPIPDDVLHRIVEAGRLTASAMNGQPWNFIVVQDKATIEQIAQVVTTGPYITQAPVVIVVAIEKTRFSLSDASRAIQSMLLTAWSDGVGSNWAGGPGMDGLKPVLDIPGELDVIAAIPFGYPAQPTGAGKKNRKALGEIAHRERFGQPFE